MKVKKFYGNDNQEAIAKVRGELGSEAVILHQRKIKPKGILGLFKRPIIEVVAAIEDTPLPTPMPISTPEKTVKKDPRPTIKYDTSNIAKTQELNLRKRVESKSKDKDLGREINDIKSMLDTVVNQMQDINISKTLDPLEDSKNNYIYNMLKNNEIDEDLIVNILNDCNEDIKDMSMEDKETIKEFFTQLIPKNLTYDYKNLDSKIIFFIGPTGVGKTTTIAKLAANYNLEKGLDVGLISADTYRIAAVEQLKVYSDILNIPLEVIYSSNEIHDAIDRLGKQDLILVDTAGRSHKNHGHVKELELLLDEVENKSVYLVISSTTKSSDIKDILSTYSFLKDYKIIFTKLDEVSTYGSILNIAMTEPEFLSYVTTGQSVPDDIEVITSNKILDMLLKEF